MYNRTASIEPCDAITVNIDALDVIMDFEDSDLSQVISVGPNISTIQLICTAKVDSIPFWLINNVAYYWQDVPPYHSYDIYTQALVIAVNDIAIFNNNQYQCHFSEDLVSNSVILNLTNSNSYGMYDIKCSVSFTLDSYMLACIYAIKICYCCYLYKDLDIIM